MANSVFISPAGFSNDGTNSTFQGGILIPVASKYGFVGVSNALALNGTATAIQASDGGNYFFVSTSATTVNSSTFTLANGATPMITIPSPSVTGQMALKNGAGTAGVGIDVATDGVLKVRTTALSAYATVDCLGLKASGAAGASFGPAAVASITVVNGIITAIS